MKKLLITGGNGFLGYHVKNELNKINIQYLAPSSIELDILNFESILSYLNKYQPNIILHMAAKCAGIRGNQNNPAIFLRDNTYMALNIYEAARLNNITKIYSIGSVCAYPANCPMPFKEEDIWNGFPEKTNAPYSQAKRTLMMLGQTYREQYGFTGAHLIPVNMYGIKDKFDLINGHVVPALIKKIINAKENNIEQVECWGSGFATRELLAVQDAAYAIVKAIRSELDTILPINIGVGQDISIYDLANLIKNIIGYTGNIVFTGEVSDGQMNRRLDVSRAKELLNWEATTSLKDGLKQTIEWYIANH